MAIHFNSDIQSVESSQSAPSLEYSMRNLTHSIPRENEEEFYGRNIRTSFKQNGNRRKHHYNNYHQNQQKLKSTTTIDNSFMSNGSADVFMRFLTLKILLWDIPISIGDVISDFAQGIALFRAGGEGIIFGLVTISINWLPGVVAVIHLLSIYRTQMPATQIIIYAVLLFLFYPIVPVIAYINLLWKKPIIEDKRSTAIFQIAEYKAMLAYAIAGGIESPIQFILQVWLIMNGKIAKPWERGHLGKVAFTDWYGNTVSIPTTATISIIFSALSIIKAIIGFNIIRIHVKAITTCHMFFKFIVNTLGHMPFLLSGAFFRIASISLLFTYLNQWAFVPIAFFGLCNLIIGYKLFKRDKVPLWLISMISTFFPICFTVVPISTRSERLQMISLQYQVYQLQSICAFICYMPSLFAAFYIINFDSNWLYESNIIMNNMEFNVGLASIVLIGILTLCLSFYPNINKYRCKKSEIQNGNDDLENRVVAINSSVTELTEDFSDVEDVVEWDQMSTKIIKRYCADIVILCKIIWGFIIIGTIFAPVLLPNIYLALTKPTNPYVVISTKSNAFVYQGLPLNNVRYQTKGLLVSCFDTTSVKEQTSFEKCIEEIRFNSKFDQILRISRTTWNARRKLILELNTSGIIIQDVNQFRPSSPLTDMGGFEKINVPVILLQDVDGKAMTEKLNESKGTVSIIYGIDSVPQPGWQCISTFDGVQKCLKPIILADGNIKGKQCRKRTCQWGGIKCHGFKNEEECQDICNESETADHFCPPHFSGSPYNHNNRKYWSRPSGCLLFRKEEQIINSCLRWSVYGTWGVSGNNADPLLIMWARSRYCYHTYSCLLRETEESLCCEDATDEDGKEVKCDPSRPPCIDPSYMIETNQNDLKIGLSSRKRYKKHSDFNATYMTINRYSTKAPSSSKYVQNKNENTISSSLV